MNWVNAVISFVVISATAFFFFRRTRGTRNLTDKFQPFRLIRKVALTKNVYINTFACPDEKKPLGLPTGRHVSVRAVVDGNEVVRSYTPSEWRKPGEFDICFKVYPDGKMTNFLKNLKVGETADFRGPTGRITYTGKGRFEQKRYNKSPLVTTFESLVLMAGGTGLTPMLQIVKHVLSDHKDSTKLYLLFANSTEEDVLLYDELVELQKNNPEQLGLILAASRPKGEWPTISAPSDEEDGFRSIHHKGRFDEAALREFVKQKKLVAPGPNVGVAICGPPSFERAMKTAVSAVGYSKEVKTMRW